jgi:hypothetical protein
MYLDTAGGTEHRLQVQSLCTYISYYYVRSCSLTESKAAIFKLRTEEPQGFVTDCRWLRVEVSVMVDFNLN